MADEWNLNVPPNSELISDLPSEHRQRKTNVAAVIEKEHATLGDGNSGGEHKNGAAVAYQGATAPTNAPDGSTALSTGDADKGRLYIDDNFDPPILCRWDGSAIEIIGTVGARLHASGDGEANAYLINLYKEDADGGRGCRLNAKGAQSGAEVTTLGYIEFAHDGAADDQKGKCTIVVNDGDDGDAPSKKAIQFGSDGKIIVANSVSVLDEDNMASNSAVQVPVQQSLVAYLEGDDETPNDSESNAMLKSHAYLTQTAGTVDAFLTAAAITSLNGYVGTTNDPAGAGTKKQGWSSNATANSVGSIHFYVAKGKYFEVVTGGSVTILWTPAVKGGGAPVDQD